MILSGVVVTFYKFSNYQTQIVKERKDLIKQIINDTISRREGRIETIASSIIGFYKGSQSVQQNEFADFTKTILEKNPEIKNIFVLYDNKIIQSYPDARYVNSNFDLSFPDYPIKIDGNNAMTTQFLISDSNMKIIIAVPFDYFVPDKIILHDNYKLVLFSPVDNNVRLYQIEMNREQEKLQGVEFSKEQVANALTIEKPTQLFEYKIHQNYNLKYVIWSDSFEKRTAVYEWMILVSGVIVSILITFLLIRHTRLSNLVRKHANELEKANKELLEIDKAKEEFSAMVSHELKTPLTPIKGYCEMLLNPRIAGEINEKQRKAIGKILSNAQKLEYLIQDVLDAQKLDMKKMKLERTEVDVASLISQNISEIKPFTIDKQIELKADIRTSGTVFCDTKRIEQVILNLVKNSIDFVPDSGGKITIRVEKDEDSNAIFTVEDNGIGIPPEKADKLFQKFYQIDTSYTRKHGGTGLGLTICKGLVEAHGGKIWVDKTHTNGAAIKFTLSGGKLK